MISLFLLTVRKFIYNLIELLTLNNKYIFWTDYYAHYLRNFMSLSIGPKSGLTHL